MKKGYVSIVTPCYNGEKYISKLIESILRQTYTKIQFILVNDGSTDQTEKVAKIYEERMKQKKYIFTYVHTKNHGQASAVNTALKLVEGEYFVEADADDYFSDDAMENMVNFLEKHPSFNAVRGNVRFFKSDEKETEETIEIRKSKNPENTDLFLNYILEEDIYCYPGVIMFRMKTFLKNNKDKNIYINKAGQNWQLILPAIYHSKTGYIDKVVYHYFVRVGSHSRTKETFLSVLKRMSNHRKILKNTIKKIVNDTDEKKKFLAIIKNKYDIREKNYILYKIRHWKD